jgi:hypothetical protein
MDLKTDLHRGRVKREIKNEKTKKKRISSK